jgi:sugar phosphate isomerase/epimerase
MPLLSLDHLTLFNLTPPELVVVAGTAGYTHVGLRLNPAAPPGETRHPVIGDTPMRRETLARMRDANVAVFDFGVFRLKAGVDVAAFEPVLESAAVLGAGHAVVNGDEPDPGILAELLHRLCALAAPYGIVMNLEPTPWTGIPTLASALEVVRRCAHPSARVMIDTIHVDRSGGTPADIARIPRELIAYVQVCDATGPRPADFATMIFQARNERAYPGEGNLDLEGMLCAAPDGVPLSLEAPVASLAATLSPVERARRGRAATLALLERTARRRGPADLSHQRSQERT